MSERLWFREAVNVADVKRRDALVRRARKIRDDAAAQKAQLEHWNRMHPDEEPFDTAFEDSVIAWCDGQGPLPRMPE